MVDVKTEIIIEKDTKFVSNYAMNPKNAPEWYIKIDNAERLSNEKYGIGSKTAFKARFLGKDLEYIYEVVELVEERKLIMRTSDGPFPMETTYDFISIDDNQTLMKLRNRGEPTGFSKLFAPFMGLMMRRANRADLKKIKKILEGQRK